MKGKFPNIRAKALYEGGIPDDQVGSSTEGMGWAGLYILWESQGGYILIEDTEGHVSMNHLMTDRLLEQNWNELTEELELSGDPDNGDYVIVCNYHYQYQCPQLSDHWFDSMEECMSAILKASLKTPIVWFENERGNFEIVETSNFLIN